MSEFQRRRVALYEDFPEESAAYEAEHGTLQRQHEWAERALRSIAANTCCGDCQEARRIAQVYFDHKDEVP